MAKIKKLGFLGAGTIAVHHALAARTLGVEVVAGCTRRPDSPHWESFRMAAPSARRLENVEAVLADPDVEGLVVCLSWDQIPRLLPRLLDCPKPMLIEKPLAFSPEEIPQERLANKIVGYNRRFYETVESVKNRLQEGDLKAVEVTISEDVNRYLRRFGPEILPRILEFSSAHSLDLLLYLLGLLRVRFLLASQEVQTGFISYNGLLTNRSGIPVWLALNQNDPSPAGIRFRFLDNTAWVLSPLETLTVYSGIEVVEPTPSSPIRKYLPVKKLEQHVDISLKPGILGQMAAFLSTQHRQAATLPDARKVLELIKEIRHVGCVPGTSQKTGSLALVANRR